MRIKKLSFIIATSLAACVLYCIMLTTKYNYYWYTSLAKLFLFVGLPILYSAVYKVKLSALFSIAGDRSALKLSASLGLATMLVIFLAFVFLRNLFDFGMIVSGLANEGITKTSYPFVFIYIIFINAFVEEIFFRGYVFKFIDDIGFSKTAYVYSSLLFSLYHISMFSTWFSPFITILCVLGLVVGGLLFDYIVKRCENIYGGYLIHLGANLAINIIGAFIFMSK